MKTPTAFFSILLVALAAVLPVKAQDQPSATNTVLAGQLVDLMHLDKAMAVGLNSMKQVRSQLLNSGTTNSSPDAKAMVQKSMETSMSAATALMTPEKMHAMYVSVYASTFSAEELQGAIDFYKSSVGQKWVEKQPQVSMAIMQQTMAMMPKMKRVSAGSKETEPLK